MKLCLRMSARTRGSVANTGDIRQHQRLQEALLQRNRQQTNIPSLMQ